MSSCQQYQPHVCGIHIIYCPIDQFDVTNHRTLNQLVILTECGSHHYCETTLDRFLATEPKCFRCGGFVVKHNWDFRYYSHLDDIPGFSSRMKRFCLKKDLIERGRWSEKDKVYTVIL